jgi:tripeptide aminopeptidase
MDERLAVKRVMEMMAIPGKSGDEAAIARYITDALLAAGVESSAITSDNAHKKSPIGGQVGNLIVKLPGTTKGPRRLLMAHIDTVPLCVGCQPMKKGEAIHSKDPATALGGDNRAGACVVLTTALTLLAKGLPHPPLTLFWPVQEEIGLVGARYVQVSKLGGPRYCFNWDGGSPEAIVIGATGADHLDITIHGLASHAGAHPEDGVSAIAIAADAITHLNATGWHGLIEKGRSAGTSNVGRIEGGAATNVVTDRVTLKGECRSHDPKFRSRIVETFRKAFESAAKGLKNSAGRCGSVDFRSEPRYESFRLDESEPVVQIAAEATRKEGLHPEFRIVNGGLDANWMTAHGLPTVTLGCGQAGIHTVEETLDIEAFLQACRIGLRLAGG